MNRKTSLLVLLTIVAALLVVASPAQSDLVINVDTTADELPGDLDNGDCSLREAVAAANGNTTVDTCVGDGEDTINLPAGSTYLLTSGNIPITDTVTINGASGGVDRSTVQQQDSDERVFTLSGASETVNINDVLMTGGNCTCDGAGMHIGAGVTVNLFASFVAVNNGGLTGKGGGIFNAGTLSALETQIGGFGAGNTAHGGGGGLYNTGVASLTNSGVTSNTSLGDGGGSATLREQCRWSTRRCPATWRVKMAAASGAPARRASGTRR